jgi:hypothetical protein
MSNDPKSSSKPSVPVPAGPAGAEPIPVARVRFIKEIDIGGKDVATGISSGGAMNEKRWEIHYLPWMRHHRILYFNPNDKGAVTRETYVHESLCYWDK